MPHTADHRPRRTWLPILTLAAALFLGLPATVRAQVNPEIANCSELKDEATLTQAELCAAHIGCNFVLGIQKTCAKAKGYLERLQTAIGKGTRNLLGMRTKEVTPEAVFNSVLGDDARSKERELGGSDAFQQKSTQVARQVKEAWNQGVLTGKNGQGQNWVYYGQTQSDKAHGTGTRIWSDGEIQRGQFSEDRLAGNVDILFPKGDRFVGSYDGGTRDGLYAAQNGRTHHGKQWEDGTFIGRINYPDGTAFQGRLLKGKKVDGTTYRADGSVSEQGQYDAAGSLSVGTRRDEAGQVTTVDVPAARAASAREEGERKRQAAVQEQQRQREEAERALQQWRASLQTMNPGQLFAMADQLEAEGKSAQSQEVFRHLLSRFPDHPLAAQAAQRLGPRSTGGAPARAGATAPTAPTPQGPLTPLNTGTCSAEQDRYREATHRTNARSLGKPRDQIDKNVTARIASLVSEFNTLDADRLSSARSDWERSRQQDLNNLQQAVNREEVGLTVNPNLTYAELGVCLLKTRLGNSGPSGTERIAPRTGNARMSPQECKAREQEISATRVPDNATVTASRETVMYMTSSILDMIASNCPVQPGVTQAQIDAERRQSQNRYEDAERGCNAVQSGGRRCVARNHFGPGGASAESLRSPDPVAPRITVPKVTPVR